MEDDRSKQVELQPNEIHKWDKRKSAVTENIFKSISLLCQVLLLSNVITAAAALY